MRDETLSDVNRRGLRDAKSDPIKTSSNSVGQGMMGYRARGCLIADCIRKLATFAVVWPQVYDHGSAMISQSPGCGVI